MQSQSPGGGSSQSGRLTSWSVAPVTDDEWAEALKNYGADRPSEAANGRSTSRYTDPRAQSWSSFPGTVSEQAMDTDEPPESSAAPDGSFMSEPEFDTSCSEGELGESETEPCPGGYRINQHFVGSVQENVLEQVAHRSQSTRSAVIATTSPALSATPGATPPETPRPNLRWPPPRQPDDFTVVNAQPPTPARTSRVVQPTEWAVADAPPMATPDAAVSYNAFGYTYNALPRQVKPTEDEGHLSAEAERRRLRSIYETDGWLPAPNPSKNTRLRRSAALRRLGLNNMIDGEMDSERHTVMMKYTELLQMFFGSYLAAIAILVGDVEIVYVVSSTRGRLLCSTAESLSGHAVLSDEWKCFVVPNMDEDWRFARNPQKQERKGHRRFFAAAPLRYHPSSGSHIDFGCLCLVDKEGRYDFSEQDQAIMLRLSNMLVFQLASLQSEIVAKHTSAMYESSINFLRRSFIPQQVKDAAASASASASASAAVEASTKDKNAAGDKKKYHHYHHRHSRRGSHIPSSPSWPSSSPRPPFYRTPQGHSPALSATPPIPTARVTKSGPKDSKSTKRKDIATELALFNDAANTLRGILSADAVCMVDLHDFQLFIRKANTRDNTCPPSRSKESIVLDFLQGKEWPGGVEPVLNYAPSSTTSGGVELLGQSCAPGFQFHFDHPCASDVIPQFIKRYLSRRHFWWDRDDPNDELAKDLMLLMPEKAQTVLATVFLTPSGTLRYATFAVWNRPSSTFDDSSSLALPFVWIVGAALVSSVALLRMRMMEESQITYSNLQAHELRTPLHQILAITQLLRSGISDLADAPGDNNERTSVTTLQQVRDLLPFLDAIDTSGKTLHGIVDNILTFLDLSARDNKHETVHSSHTAGIVMSPAGAPQTLGAMLEELIHEANAEDRRARIGSGQTLNRIETVFEIIPLDLGDAVTEDLGMALRRALSRVINNAYRYIDGQGCVEIYVDDIKSMLPPEGCEDLGASRSVSITVVDNGRGMGIDFVQDKLGEPWAKEDLYATGSGLSVHLSYRIIELMGGQMEIASAPGAGCTVSIEVALPVTRGWQALASETAPAVMRKVGFIGFDPNVDPAFRLDRLQTSLERQYKKMGCKIVPLAEAELVIADGSLEETPEGMGRLAQLMAPEVVILAHDTENLPPVADMSSLDRRIRRFIKPVTSALLRETLAYTLLAAPTDMRPRAHFNMSEGPSGASSNSSSALAWKRGVCVEEAVASLSLGDYISSRRRPSRANSNASSGVPSLAAIETASTDSQLHSSLEPDVTPLLSGAPSPIALPTSSDDLFTEPAIVPATMARTKVLVVEDNIINRKILVKILSATMAPVLEILEAEDGLEAVERFTELTAPGIVLLDINMPRMDGYAAAVEMRQIEKRRATGWFDGTVTPAARSRIIAVTALAGEDERRRGLVECGIDAWLTKPCPKKTLQGAVDEALKQIQSAQI